jgi:hypothetical protein
MAHGDRETSSSCAVAATTNNNRWALKKTPETMILFAQKQLRAAGMREKQVFVSRAVICSYIL